MYLMHGYSKYEREIEGRESIKSNIIEYCILSLSDCIVCVSKQFMEFMKKREKRFSNKFNYINNSVPFYYNSNSSVSEKKSADQYNILSVGGGRPIKNIVKICEAIDLLEKNGYKVMFTVIGKEGRDTEKIKKFNFVNYIENVNYNDMYKYYDQANLYIQNSYLETFGLSVIEAVMRKCNLLISENVGCKNLINNLSDKNIIYNNQDINEIKEKIMYLIENNLSYTLRKEELDINHNMNRLTHILYNLNRWN